MLFRYRALENRKIVTKTIETGNEAMVLQYLRKRNLFPLEIKRAESWRNRYLGFFFNRVSFNDIVNFTRQMAIMLNAGLTLIDCFDILKKQISKPAFLAVVKDIDKGVRGGEAFSTTLEKYPHLFSRLYISLVKSGEATGKLSDILLKLADNLEKEREFKGKIKGAMIYPTIVIIAMIAVIFIMITFVLPQLLNLYKDFKIQLPITTRILIAVSGFTTKFWPIIIGATIGLFLLLKAYLKTNNGKLLYYKTLMKLPIVNNVVKISSLVDATRTLSILIQSGVSILDSLQIVIDSTENVIYQKSFKNLYKQVERGSALGTSMEKEGIFPPILVQMTIVGEQTGHLDETLKRISSYFESESELATKALTSLIEPAVLLFLGVGVGFLAISVITPIYKLTSSFG